ncbi:MAG: SGNH/GDSL hydrolase family protein [Planctomycetaceae bacterium]|nr:SGNH/GDSL hydrolase family protein [Planctomycetaceae bacterium]
MDRQQNNSDTRAAALPSRALRFVALGDCNTHTGDPRQGTIPRGLVRALGLQGIATDLSNLGGGMETCREGLSRLENTPVTADIATINYGLVDAWSTCVPGLYVPYYPDSFVRKRLRKALKFTKRRLLTSGLRRWLPSGAVVPETEFREKIGRMIAVLRERHAAVQIYVWGTVLVANHPQRNHLLLEYNDHLQHVAENENVVFVDSESAVADLPIHERTLDGVHLTPAAAERIATVMAVHCRGRLPLEASAA